MTKEEEVKKVMALANKSILNERIHKIDMVMREYGEENFYLAFSGGRDSTVLHHLLDIARPGNEIPRVYADTGIEYNEMRNFVIKLAAKDKRVHIIKPSIPIKQMLERDGYPFKSKIHSHCVHLFQIGSDNKMVLGYLGKRPETWHTKVCPKVLEYQFTENNKLKISDKCCIKMKEEPMMKYAKQTGKSTAIIGTMRVEGGAKK